MLTKNHAQLTVEVRKHIEADAVIKGDYWDGEKGCFIGCLAHSADASVLGDLYGLPLPLVRICEDIFEGLPIDAAKAFFAAIPDAIGRDGKDLTRVHWQFLAETLRDMPPQEIELQAVIDPIIAGMDRLSRGEAWLNAADAAAAARAAAAGADAAAFAARAAAGADAAAFAARAAAAAARAAEAQHARAVAFAAARAAAGADAARAAQRDLILKLIREAE